MNHSRYKPIITKNDERLNMQIDRCIIYLRERSCQKYRKDSSDCAIYVTLSDE